MHWEDDRKCGVNNVAAGGQVQAYAYERGVFNSYLEQTYNMKNGWR